MSEPAAASRSLAERIDYFLAERKALGEHMQEVNERLGRGEVVMMGGAPVAPIAAGWKLLNEAREECETLRAVLLEIIEAAGEIRMSEGRSYRTLWQLLDEVTDRWFR